MKTFGDLDCQAVPKELKLPLGFEGGTLTSALCFVRYKPGLFGDTDCLDCLEILTDTGLCFCDLLVISHQGD